MLSKYFVYALELIRTISLRIRLNPLYVIPYIFLIAVMLFAMILGLAVFILPK